MGKENRYRSVIQHLREGTIHGYVGEGVLSVAMQNGGEVTRGTGKHSLRNAIARHNFYAEAANVINVGQKRNNSKMRVK